MSNSSEREQYKTPLQQVNSFTAYQWVVWMDARIHVMNNKSNDYNEYAFAFPDLGIIDIISPIEGLLTLFNLLNKKAKEQFRQ